MNKVFLCGHLGQDPETRVTTSGITVASLNLATTERRKDKDGEWTDHTEWHKVVVWAGLADTVAKYCTKGSKVTVEGRLQTRKWQDKEGQDRYTTEIVADQVHFMSNGAGGGKSEDRGRGRDDDRGGEDRGGRGQGRDQGRGREDRGGRGRDERGGRSQGRDDDRGRGNGRGRDADTY